MRLALPAGTLAAAVRSASLAATERSPIPALAFAHLIADAGGLAITGNSLDHSVTVTVPAEIEQPGEAAPRAVTLAALAEGFPPDAPVTLAVDGTVLAVCSGRARYRLPMIPVTDLPPLLQVDAEAGRVEIEAAALQAILRRTAFAASREGTRYYLEGVHLQSDGEQLVACATDGHRLARAATATQGTLAEGGLIVPNEAIALLAKLLKRGSAPMALRQSRSLLEFAGDGFVLVTKLIDGTFPDCDRIIPRDPRHCATIATAELRAALERLDAALSGERFAGVSLHWSGDTLHMSLSDCANEELAAHDVEGSGQVTVRLQYLADLLKHMDGARVRLATNGPDEPLVVTDPDDAALLFLQLPLRAPPSAKSQAA